MVNLFILLSSSPCISVRFGDRKAYKICEYLSCMEEKKIQLDIVIYPENGEEGMIYSISSVQVPNVVTQGRSVEDAIRMLREALELYFEEAPWERENLIEMVEDEEASPPMISRISL